MPECIKIVIIDDHQLFRAGLKSIFAMDSLFNVVDEADDGESGLKCIQNHKPNIVLLDISLPGISGIELCKQILNQFSDMSVIMLTMHKSDEFLKESFKAGASGFLLKHSAVAELTTAIKTVCNGKTYISADMTESVISKMLLEKPNHPEMERELTAKEKEIVRLIAQGWENQDIANALHISLSTAKTHRANIMKKLDIHKNVDIVKYALKNHLIELD